MFLMRLWFGLVWRLWAVMLTALGANMAFGYLVLPTEEVAYTARVDGDFEIFLLDTRRYMTTNLTKTRYWRNARYDSQDQAPTWSPDGRYLAYQSNREGNADIWMLDIHSGETRRLTSKPSLEIYPDWSGDGAYLVYQGWQDNDYDLFLINMRAVLARNVTAPPRQLTDNVASDTHPVFSPDGAHIVYISDEMNVTGHYSLMRVNVDSREREKLAVIDDQTDAQHPEWSPDGTTILFNSYDERENGDIFMVRSDGSEPAHGVVNQLFDTSNEAYTGNWSLDGTRLYFAAYVNASDTNLYVAPLVAPQTLGPPRQLTTNTGVDIQPAPRPR